MPRRSCVADGWRLLHDAIMRAGAEVDYYPPEEPELKGRSYLSPGFYRELSGPLIDFAGVDIEALGNRADLVKRAIWRWIRRASRAEANGAWKTLLTLRNRVQVLAGFSDLRAHMRFLGAPLYEPGDPASVVRFGYWLVTARSRTETSPIVPVLWGLALIGAGWRGKGTCGYCEFCYRHAYPGSRFCPFHRQVAREEETAAQAYVRYRKGRRAAALDAALNGAGRSFAKSVIMDHETGRQALATILFPMIPTEGWARERKELIEALEMAPRVLKLIGGKRCFRFRYETLVVRLRKHIDPCNYDDFMWSAVVWRAEQWLALEATPSKRKRGKGKSTQGRVEKAVEMACAGDSNGQIALALGVAPSTVSSWVCRYPEFRKASLKQIS